MLCKPHRCRSILGIVILGPGPAKFVPGPMPASSQAPATDPLYSGLLECPMTSRLSKAIDGTYILQGASSSTAPACVEPIVSFQECFHAATALLSTGGQTFVNQSGSDPARPRGCSVTTTAQAPLEIHVFFNKLADSTATCNSGSSTLVGATESLVDVLVSLDTATDTATITLTGPADVWYGVGFGAQAMADEPWTIIVDGSGDISERKLGGPNPNSHVAGTELKPSVKVVSSSTATGKRTVVLSRPLKGYYTFNASALGANPQIPFISAIGNGPSLAYHKDKAPSTLSLLPVSATAGGTCVCPAAPKPFGHASGRLVYHAVANQSADVGSGSVAFGPGKCQPYPYTTQIPDRNPTCDIRHYR